MRRPHLPPGPRRSRARQSRRKPPDPRRHAGQAVADRLLKDYDRLLRLTRPLTVLFPAESEILAARPLIRHLADAPVQVSAMQSRPDWLLTHNTKHFSPAVARRTGLRIGTPADFFLALSQGIK